MARLNIINYEISGSFWVENAEYSITTPDIQSDQAYIWDIHSHPEGEPPFKIGEAMLWKYIDNQHGFPCVELSIVNTAHIVMHKKLISKGLLETSEPIIDTIRGSIRLREII